MDTPLRPITDVAGDLGLTADDLEPYGRYKAKLDLVKSRLSSFQS